LAKPDVSLQTIGWQAPPRRKYIAESRISPDLLREKQYFGDIPVDTSRDDTALPCAVAFGRKHWGKDFIAVGRADWIQYPYGIMLHATFAIWREERSGENKSA